MKSVRRKILANSGNLPPRWNLLGVFMRAILAALLFLGCACGASASENSLNCSKTGGDELSADGSDRLSPKMELKITDSLAALTGKIWGKQQTDSGRRVEDKEGQAVYQGFEQVMHENSDCTLSLEKSLLKGKAGKAVALVKGDRKNSVDLRYEFFCQ